MIYFQGEKLLWVQHDRCLRTQVDLDTVTISVRDPWKG